MENYYVLLMFYFFFMSLMLMFWCFKHLLLMLLSMEFIMVSLMFELYMIMMNLGLNEYFLIYYFLVMICEAILGLSILVILIRFYGNDYCKMVIF